MSYQDATERVWQFTIRYTEFATHKDRQYLDCWCNETSGNQDLPELAHNWDLRIDHIATDVAIAPATGQWRSGLATSPVELYPFRELAFAYHSKTVTDTVNKWVTD